MYQTESYNNEYVHPERQRYVEDEGSYEGNERRNRGRDRRGADRRDGGDNRNRHITYIDPEESILHTEWVPANRPYSQNELQFLEERLFNKLQIVDLLVQHSDCGHCYRIKKNGVRYKKMVEDECVDNSNPPDIGNCSVCWKISKTPRELGTLVDEFLELHNNFLENERKTYFSYLVNKLFYTWLYKEMFNF